MTLVCAGVCKALCEPEEARGLEVPPGRAPGLKEGLAGEGKEPGLGTVTALVRSGRRGTGGDLEKTVVLGSPAEVIATLVVATALDTAPGGGVCNEWGRDEDSGAWGLNGGRLVVTPWPARASVVWTGR